MKHQTIMVFKIKLFKDHEDDHHLELIMSAYNTNVRQGVTERRVVDIEDDIIKVIEKNFHAIKDFSKKEFNILYDVKAFNDALEAQRSKLVDDVNKLIDDEILDSSINFTAIFDFDKPKASKLRFSPFKIFENLFSKIK